MNDEPVVSIDPSEVSPAEIRELLTLTRDNNRYLKDMRFWGRVAFWFKVVVWSLVLILPLLLYPLLAPFFGASTGTGATGSSTSLFGIPSPAEIQKALHPGK